MIAIRSEKDLKAGEGKQTFRLVKWTSRMQSMTAKMLTDGGC